MKLHIQGFRGEWGWVDEFESYATTKGIEITSIDDCDILFQCDHENWKPNLKYLGEKIVIANVLDFAEWVGGNQNIEDYVDQFVRKADFKFAICNDVIEKLSERGIDGAEMFYYPSQIDLGIINSCVDVPKKNQVVTFSRLGDPGKKIDVAVDQFVNSGLIEQGWRYLLIGPEPPRFSLPMGVHFLGMMPKETLFMLVASSRININAETGTGLGLPGIEASMVGTIPLCRNIIPISDVLKGNALFFDTDEMLGTMLSEFASGKFDEHTLNFDLVKSWERTMAFDLFINQLEVIFNES
jgi:hypothetical protein